MAAPVRRLIETDQLPIGVISRHARRDQNVRKGHLHAMHVWWATRPLAACRAALMATLLPDPLDPRCPDAFRQAARAALAWRAARDLRDPAELRRALLGFLADFAAWEAGVDQRYLETARALVRAAHPDGPPLVVDPFAGMGSIPFEALRIGAEAFAGDLNPVAVLLNKVALEYLPTYGQRLAEAVRTWGAWVRQRAAAELQPFYPTEPDGSIPVAYTWARTIHCEGPGCGATVPLVGLLWLSRRAGNLVALRYRGDRATKQVHFEIIRPGSERDVQPGIVRRFAATCPVCGYTTPYKQVREQLRAKRGGTRDARPIAVITLKPSGGRGYRLATPQDAAVAERAAAALARRQAAHPGPLPLVPDEPLPPEGALGFRVNLYGMTTWGDLFAPRQALALSIFAQAVRDAHAQVVAETGDAPFARAVATCLALAVSNSAPMLSAGSYYGQDHIRTFFLGSGLPMRPDFAEANPLMPKLVGGFEYTLEQVVHVLEHEAGRIPHAGSVRQGSATAMPLPDDHVPYVVTDPPYYDAVPYAALSDLCYVWLKRMLADLHPDLFRSPLTPKAEECILDPGPPPPGEPEKTRAFFEDCIRRALAECRRILQPGGLAVVIFAHKGTAGWEALLNALVQAAWTVTASWPIETERLSRTRALGSAALQSSVFLVCRPREGAAVGEWRDVLDALNRKVADWLPRLAREGIEGADAIFACLGPALEVYSRYARVETAGGQPVPLADVRNGRGEVVQRGYLSYVWEAVAREALRVIFPDADPSGFEEDARFTAMWLWTVRARANGRTAAAEQEEAEDEDEPPSPRRAGSSQTLPYDDARLIIQGLGAREEMLKRPGGVLEIAGEVARLRSVAERRRWLLGDDAPSVAPPAPRGRRRGGVVQLALGDAPEAASDGWEPSPVEGLAVAPGQTTLDRVHQAMLLFADGRSETLRNLLVDQGIGRDERFWRLANALAALYPRSAPEKRLVDGLIARRKALGL
jgi:adenine-specific DNA methylase